MEENGTDNTAKLFAQAGFIFDCIGQRTGWVAAQRRSSGALWDNELLHQWRLAVNV